MACVYFHRRKKDNTVFYVGVGNEKRPFSDKNRNKYWHNVVSKDDGFNVDIRFKNISKKLAFYFEKKYILFFGRKNYDKNGILVNAGIGGEGTSGFKMSDETKKRISIGVKKAFKNKDIYDRMVKAKIGRKHSEETKLKMSINNGAKQKKERERRRRELLNPNHPMRKFVGEKHYMYGKKMNEETKKKISNSKKGIPSKNRKKIYQFTLDNILVKEYDSLIQASKELKTCTANISDACNGKQKTAKGFIWRYQKS